MKKIIASLLLMSSAINMSAAVNVNRIEPTDWYVGMKDASLQLMVYGKDIKNADVTVDYPGVKVVSSSRTWRVLMRGRTSSSSITSIRRQRRCRFLRVIIPWLAATESSTKKA